MKYWRHSGKNVLTADTMLLCDSQKALKRLTAREHAMSLLLFAIVTCGYLFPYLRNPQGFNGSGDEAVFANAFWWFRKCLTEFKNPFFSDYLFFPDGMSLVFHTTTFANFLLTLPVQLIWGESAAVNAAYFMTFVLTGYFTFLLVFELTASREAALVSAFIYAFAPFHFHQGRAHLQIATLQWLPLYFLFLKRTLEELRSTHALTAGMAFGLILLTDQLQTICAAMVTVAVVLVAGISVRKKRQVLIRGLGQVMILGGVAAVCASIYLFPLLRELLNHRAATKIAPLDHGGANMFSADLLGFFVPGFHRLWGGGFSSLNLGLDSVVYIGFISLMLAGYGVWRCRRERIVLWTLFIAGFFWIMSLGTYLHIGGVWEFGSLRIPLPYLAMTDIPVIGENRTPCRFHLMTMLAVAVLAGFGVRELLSHAACLSPRRKWLVSALLLTLLLVETIPPRQEPGETPIPAVYLKMATDREAYSVLQLPLSRWSAIYKNGSGGPSIMMYMQTFHGKPIFGGLASRLVPDDLVFPSSLLDLLKDLSSYDNAIVRGHELPSENEIEAVRYQGKLFSSQREQFIKQYHIGYITINPPISGMLLSRVFLEAFMGKEFSMNADDGVAYLRVAP